MSLSVKRCNNLSQNRPSPQNRDCAPEYPQLRRVPQQCAPGVLRYTDLVVILIFAMLMQMGLMCAHQMGENPTERCAIG